LNQIGKKLCRIDFNCIPFVSIFAPSESATQQQTNLHETIAPLFFFDDTMLVADILLDVYFL